MKALILVASLCLSSLGWSAQTATDRLKDATDVLNDIMATPDKSIPHDLMDKAYCAIVVPGVKKAAFIVGGKYGKGFAVCRKSSGDGWGAPAAIRVEGGSVGFQIGGSDTDVVMLVMNPRGMRDLAKSKFTLGADASVAAGPVGRTTSADTSAYMNAEILSWSRAKGLFAGIALNGATLRPDLEGNKELYGQNLTTGDIVLADRAPAPAASAFISALNRYSMRKVGEPMNAQQTDTENHRKAGRKK